LKSLTIVPVLSMVIILLVLVSCKSLERVQEVSGSGVQEFRSATDTAFVRDSIYRHDSIIYRERTIHDTVYITKEIFRDTHNSSLIARNSSKADTVRVTEYRDRVIEQPPERYVPKFYKWCTWLFFILLLGTIGYLVIKIRQKIQ
jgi:hypothetical protein